MHDKLGHDDDVVHDDYGQLEDLNNSVDNYNGGFNDEGNSR